MPTPSEFDDLVRELNLAGTLQARMRVVVRWHKAGAPEEFIAEGIARAGLNADLTYLTPASSNDNGTNSSQAD